MSLSKNKIGGIFGKYLLLITLLTIVLIPFYWMVVTAFRPMSELYSKQISFFPESFTFEHIIELFNETDFIVWFLNSWKIAILTTIVSLIVGALGAYSLVRFTYKGQQLVARFILATYLIPRTVLFIPIYKVLRDLGLYNTHAGLIFSYITFAIPFCTWMLMGYFSSIPEDMEQAGMIDGCTKFETFYKILLPLATPGLIASGLFSFNLANNEYLYAMSYIDSPRLMTLPRGLSTMIMGDVFLWGKMMSAALLASVPLVIFYIFVQKYMVYGVTAGSVKG